MKKSSLAIYVVVIMGCLLFGQTVKAQDSSTYGTVDYDSETNTVYGYAYTQADYAASLYYNRAYVRVWLKDASGNDLAVADNTGYGRAEVSVQAAGNGNAPYRVETYHKTWTTYYVNGYYNQHTHRYENGYLDYYYYTYYERGLGGNIYNNPLFNYFLGRRPEFVSSSIDRWLGTLLTSLYNTDARVTWQNAAVYDVNGSFGQAQYPTATIMAANSSRRLDICGTSNSQSPDFTLRVYFKLHSGTSLAPTRCTARAIGEDPDYQIRSGTVRCVIDSPEVNGGYLDATVYRKCCPAGNPSPRISIGVGCNNPSGQTGACDDKAVVKILC